MKLNLEKMIKFILIFFFLIFRVDPKYWDDYRALYRRRCKIYEEKLIEGSHYIHMTHAELLSDEIVKFINKSTELRLGNKL